MKVKYSCNLCGLHRVEVEAPVRWTGQDIATWMRVLTVVLEMDHSIRSPHCAARKLDEVMIPIQDNKPIGSSEK